VPLAALILLAIVGSILLALYALPWAWMLVTLARRTRVRSNLPDPEMAKLSAELEEFKVSHHLDGRKP
jgi:uncharacterized membrane protein AbrB (regulator of aidB expression)